VARPSAHQPAARVDWAGTPHRASHRHRAPGQRGRCRPAGAGPESPGQPPVGGCGSPRPARRAPSAPPVETKVAQPSHGVSPPDHPSRSGSGEPRHGRRGNAPTLPGAQANSAFPARGNAAPRRTVTWVCAGWPDAAPAPRAGICPNTGQRFRRAGETSRLRLAKPLRALVTVNVRSGVPLQGLFGGVPRAPSEGGAADGGGTGHACSGCWQARCRWPATLRRRGLQCSALPRAHRRLPRNAGAVPQRAGTRPRPSCAARTLPSRVSSSRVAGCAAS
jgi:hypothetical protein